VAVIAGGLGAVAAWLVAMHRFPGRGLFTWALALPLAAPAFALAYGYADLLDVAGPFRTFLRAEAGFDLPLSLRSLWGAAFVLGLAFYPYTYLTLRAALEAQAAQAVEAARTLGAKPWRAFIRVALPMAWPALHRGDGTIMLALQQHAGSGDASRDLAALLLRALELAPGTPITSASPGRWPGRRWRRGCR
ncbi:MAG: DUF5926 family protein, partial [Brevundimonas sp.]